MSFWLPGSACELALVVVGTRWDTGQEWRLIWISHSSKSWKDFWIPWFLCVFVHIGKLFVRQGEEENYVGSSSCSRSWTNYNHWRSYRIDTEQRTKEISHIWIFDDPFCRDFSARGLHSVTWKYLGEHIDDGNRKNIECWFRLWIFSDFAERISNHVAND